MLWITLQGSHPGKLQGVHPRQFPCFSSKDLAFLFKKLTGILLYVIFISRNRP